MAKPAVDPHEHTVGAYGREHSRERILVWRFGAALGPWSALSMWTASTGSSTPSFTDSTWNGETAPSRFLHMPLNITFIRLSLTRISEKRIIGAHYASPRVMKTTEVVEGACGP